MYPTLYIGLFSTCCENLRMRRDYSVQGWCTKSKETKNKTPVTASQLHWVLWIEKNQRNEENSAIPGEEDDKAFILKPTHFSCSGLHRGYQIDVLQEGFLHLVEEKNYFYLPLAQGLIYILQPQYVSNKGYKVKWQFLYVIQDFTCILWATEVIIALHSHCYFWLFFVKIWKK